ncbi:MAG: PspC domain-containing protein [Acidimicrobiales bacterium]|nr:PspC domain-containing protein [Acidimicrobiales bacterium]MCB9392932.1 PspC domain-containing protein [Acidimicrobiaceae bacterium]
MTVTGLSRRTDAGAPRQRGWPAFRRRDEGRVIAGVAGGFADEHGVDPTLLRAALVVLSFAGGLGLVLYAVGALLATAPDTDALPVAPRPIDRQRTLAVASVTAGLLLIVRSTGLWLGDAVMVPLSVVAAGLVLIGVVRPEVGERPWQMLASTPVVESVSGRRARARLFAGAALVSFGLLLVGAREGTSSSVRVGAIATALTVIGVVVLVGPWLTRLAQEAAAERRERIRVQEREAMAAHLHDSVLQTLALIQRTADDPRRTITLARQQERELRAWLYGARASSSSTTLASSLRQVVHEVESAYDVQVDLVVVGDAPVGDAVDALVAATREACINAAKHAGTTEVSVFAEVRDGAAEVFVRDRGVGFDRATVAADRRGIAHSIEGRLDRVGGTAQVESAPGAGTEVQMRAPVVDGPPTEGTA